MPFKALRFFKNKKVILALIIILIFGAILKNLPENKGQVKADKNMSASATAKTIKQNTEKYQPRYDWYKNNPGTLGLTAESAIVIDHATGEVLFAKNEHKQLPPASITKILTLTVVLENMKLDQLCTVSQTAADTQPNKITMKAGEQMKVEDLLYGLTMISANDAAEVLAECYEGGRDKFLEEMNERVKLLGLNDSKFYDPNGLNDETQVSSAYDIGTITRYALLTQPDFIKFIGRKEDYGVQATDHNESHYWYQISHLLQSYSGMEGAKTGYTHIAKNTYVGVANRNGRRIIIVYFAAETKTSDATSLLEYGFSVKP